jgi:hypothetical protein
VSDVTFDDRVLTCIVLQTGTSSLTLSQAPSNDGAEQPLVSPVSPGERKSLPPVPGADKKLPPPLPKKQPNIVFHPPSNPPPNPGGPKKVSSLVRVYLFVLMPNLGTCYCTPKEGRNSASAAEENGYWPTGPAATTS